MTAVEDSVEEATLLVVATSVVDVVTLEVEEVEEMPEVEELTEVVVIVVDVATNKLIEGDLRTSIKTIVK